MKIIDQIKRKTIGKNFVEEELDNILEEYKYYPPETDDGIENVIKYTNGRSEIWIYIEPLKDSEFYVANATVTNKKPGKTTVRPLRDEVEIKSLMDYFRNNGKYKEFMVFVLEMLLARRVGDTLSLRWSDFYYSNGRKKETLNTLVEDKTGKIIELSITEIVWKWLDWYCDKMNIDPIANIHAYLFPSEEKITAKTDSEYKVALKKQTSSFRYEFKKAAEYCKIENVSTHSIRKTFGYIAHSINRYDPDCLDVLQTILGHSDRETTKRYIGIMQEKSDKYFDDVAHRIDDIDNGVKTAIDNIPVIGIKTNDLRDIIYLAIKAGREDNRNEAEILNEFISQVELKRVG